MGVQDPHNIYTVFQLDTTSGVFEVDGRILGKASSHEPRHSPHGEEPNVEYAPKGLRCSGCRWFEVHIYGSNPNTRQLKYLVFTRGATIVPGERNYDKLVWTDSPYEVLETLTVRKRGIDPSLPGPSAKALAQAAALDDGIRSAYLNRAVL